MYTLYYVYQLFLTSVVSEFTRVICYVLFITVIVVDSNTP